jgi:hypothetical protein
MIKEKDAGVEAVAVEAMGLDATPNASYFVHDSVAYVHPVRAQIK